VAAIPLPGIATVAEITIVKLGAEFYYMQLGLDETSLKRYAELTNTDYRKLESIIRYYLGHTCRERMQKLVEEIIMHGTAVVVCAAVAEGAKCIPFIGSLIAAPVTFGGTRYALKLVLDKLESAALEVVQCAAKSAASDED